MDVIVVIAEFKRLLKSRGYAEKSIDLYSAGLNEFRDWLIRQDIDDLRTVSHDVMRKYQRDLSEQKIAIETRAIKLRPVKRLFEYLTEENKLLVNPAEKIVETCRVNRKIGTVLTEDEVRRLLDQPNLSLKTGIRDRAIIEVFYSTGIRINELLHLTVYDPDLKDQVLYIKKGKGKKQRVVPLGKTACDYLKEYLTRIRPYYARKNPKERILFLTVLAGPMTSGALLQIFRKYRTNAGIKKNVTGHTLRRTCATHMLTNGADVRYIQKLLGHRHLKTTQIYTKVVPVDIKKTHEQTHSGLKS